MNKKIAFRFGEDKRGIIPWLEVYNYFVRDHGDLTGKMFTAVFSILSQPKTYNQLKYFHCDEFLLRFAEALARSGSYGRAPEEEKKLKDWAKRQIKLHPDIHLYEVEKNAFTGAEQVVLESFADVSKKRMSEIIEWCMEIAEEYLGVTLESAEEYKRKLKKRRNRDNLNS